MAPFVSPSFGEESLVNKTTLVADICGKGDSRTLGIRQYFTVKKSQPPFRWHETGSDSIARYIEDILTRSLLLVL